MKVKISVFIFGCLFSFMIGIGLHHGYAKHINPEIYMGPKVENVQDIQGGIRVETIWHEGRKYHVFTSGYSSMHVIKQ